ncbi:MAG: hypothetical protein U5L72_17220 [Bacteroidales bacterium]|nr:hypothetical protein [Bacteroidales bacterium]
MKDLPRRGNEAAETGAGPATGVRKTLTTRQQKELGFWLRHSRPAEGEGKLKLLYNPATAQYRDSLFSLTVSPILGYGRY